MPTKYFILDASVLLSAGKRALFGFKENNVVIPMSVIETLEAKKNDPQLGFTAMSTLKEIYKLKGDSKGEGTVGSPFNITPEGGSLHIEMNHISSKEFKEQYNIEGHDKHLRILSVIYNLQKENKDIKLILVSNSISLRIKAHALNIETTEFQAKSEHSRGYYKGYIEGVHVPGDVFQKIHDTSKQQQPYHINKKYFSDHKDLPNNFGAEFVSGGGNVYARVSTNESGNLMVQKVSYKKNYGKDFTPGSPQQYIAADYFSPDNKPNILSVGGAAGTGKTALALAVGIDNLNFFPSSSSVDDHSAPKAYDKIVVFRPMNPVGQQDYGYLPGDAEEKMGPWGGAIMDALSASVSENVINSIKNSVHKPLEILPVTHIRGRTFTNTLMIIDEAQNLESIVLLTALSRAGHGTKVVFLWDQNQRDNYNISKDDGIINIVEYFKDSPEFAHIVFEKSERSKIAELANTAIEDLGL